jgi:hypothetical protein
MTEESGPAVYRRVTVFTSTFWRGKRLAWVHRVAAGRYHQRRGVPCVTGIWVCDSPGPHH